MKTSTVGFFRALGRYKAAESTRFLREIRHSGLLDASLYTLTVPERLKLALMRLCPLPLCAALRFLVLCKRRILSLTH